LGAGGFATQPAYALTNCTVSDYSLDSQEQAFLTLINNYRAQNGRAALSTSSDLNRSSTWLATDMATKGYFSHTDSLGRSPSTRAQNCGYGSGAGENIAAGTSWDTAQEVFDAWKGSSGHNANMLNSGYKQIGIARHYNANSPYKWYWVTDFGTLSGSGGATSTAVSTAKAVITSPTPGSTLPGSSVTFRWSSGSGAKEYFLYVGTIRGSNNLYGHTQGLNRSVTVSGLPADGRILYVRLWTRFSSGWQYTDYTYRAAP
jgi:uncharacterized protein YkwD